MTAEEIPPEPTTPTVAPVDAGDRPAPSDSPTRDLRHTADRTADDRLADHAAIERLADDLIPALIAKLSASGLGEIEVGEGDWTIRVRRPPDGDAAHGRRGADRDRTARGQTGHAGHGHVAGGFEGHRGGRDIRPVAGTAPVSSNGATAGAAPPADGSAYGSGDAQDDHRAIATSPAVGIFQPRPEARAGSRVRSGDRLGAVDMLGVPQEVVAPADGIVGATLAEPGEAVEYGQELVVIELVSRSDRTAERTEG